MSSLNNSLVTSTVGQSVTNANSVNNITTESKNITATKSPIIHTIEVSKSSNNEGQKIAAGIHFNSDHYPKNANISKTTEYKDNSTSLLLKTDYEKGDKVQSTNHSIISNTNNHASNSSSNSYYKSTTSKSSDFNLVGIIAASVFGVILIAAMAGTIFFLVKRKGTSTVEVVYRQERSNYLSLNNDNDKSSINKNRRNRSIKCSDKNKKKNVDKNNNSENKKNNSTKKKGDVNLLDKTSSSLSSMNTSAR